MYRPLPTGNYGQLLVGLLQATASLLRKYKSFGGGSSPLAWRAGALALHAGVWLNFGNDFSAVVVHAPSSAWWRAGALLNE